MKVCIIGCGISGLSSIRRCREKNLECVAFDQASDIGGTWLYSENSGIDEFGLPVLTSIYPSLRTNLPTVAMEFEGFEFKTSSSDTCYPSHEEVLRYIRNFADYFNLWTDIKLCHRIESVKRIEDYWEVTVKNLKSQEIFVRNFDSVIVASGHYSEPFIPDIPGIHSFYGIEMHSHYYRRSGLFKHKNVLIIGSGTSGLDLCYEFKNVSNKTFFSHHHPELTGLNFPENVVHKPDVKHVSNQEVHFKDDSVEKIDVILYCTGYKYDYPFLDESCGLKIIENKFVCPLYKMIINIEQPTMSFLGIPMRSVFFAMSDLQVRAFLSSLLGVAKMPSTEEMLKAWKTEMEQLQQKNVPVSKYHCVGPEFIHTMQTYMRDLEAFANLPTVVPNVIIKIFSNNARLRKMDYSNFRTQKYTIIDENSYRLDYKGEIQYG